jgi:hypothetical protein
MELRAITRRSRTGCNECRRRHRKCNEIKPTCAYCDSVGVQCVYGRKFSWGGRPFKKSRFGKCLDAGATTVSIHTSGGKCSGRLGRQSCSCGSSHDQVARIRVWSVPHTSDTTTSSDAGAETKLVRRSTCHENPASRARRGTSAVAGLRGR